MGLGDDGPRVCWFGSGWVDLAGLVLDLVTKGPNGIWYLINTRTNSVISGKFSPEM